jgi:hypothetical protein
MNKGENLCIPSCMGPLPFIKEKRSSLTRDVTTFVISKEKHLLITLGETKVTPASRVNNVIQVSIGVHGARKVSPCPAQVNLKPFPINLAIQK